jgi:hypothetical protein
MCVCVCVCVRACTVCVKYLNTEMQCTELKSSYDKFNDFKIDCKVVLSTSTGEQNITFLQLKVVIKSNFYCLFYIGNKCKSKINLTTVSCTHFGGLPMKFGPWRERWVELPYLLCSWATQQSTVWCPTVADVWNGYPTALLQHCSVESKTGQSS